MPEQTSVTMCLLCFEKINTQSGACLSFVFFKLKGFCAGHGVCASS